VGVWVCVSIHRQLPGAQEYGVQTLLGKVTAKVRQMGAEEDRRFTRLQAQRFHSDTEAFAGHTPHKVDRSWMLTLVIHTDVQCDVEGWGGV
jgi:hypothetical protein